MYKVARFSLIRQRLFRTVLPCAFVLTLVACASPKSPQPDSDWQSMNVFKPDVKVLPLRVPYTFSALPIDATLMAMLQRWANDSSIKLSYQCGDDFSIPSRLLLSRVSTLRAALSETSSFYSDYGLNLDLSADKSILVANCGNDMEVRRISNSLRADSVDPDKGQIVAPQGKALPAPPSSSDLISFEQLLANVNSNGALPSIPSIPSMPSILELNQPGNSPDQPASVAEKRVFWPSARIGDAPFSVDAAPTLKTNPESFTAPLGLINEAALPTEKKSRASSRKRPSSRRSNERIFSPKKPVISIDGVNPVAVQ